MSFKKLNSELREKLESNGFKEALPFQKKIISNIKSGSNIYVIGPAGIGKSTALVISTLNKLNYQSVEDAPRAVILVKDKEAALAMEENFRQFTKPRDIRVYSAYEQGKIEDQREEIYIGIDVLIATPKRLSKLYFQNGINLKILQLFIIEDAQFLERMNFITEIIRLSESISKCQYVIFADSFTPKLNKFKTHFMQQSILLKN